MLADARRVLSRRTSSGREGSGCAAPDATVLSFAQARLWPPPGASRARFHHASRPRGHKPRVPMIALAHEHLVGPPPERLALGAVAPADHGPAARLGAEGKVLEAYDRFDGSLSGHASPRRQTAGRRSTARTLPELAGGRGPRPASHR